MHTNRLARENSPYLLQHQHNPVDWYPWGDEAFALAAAEDKPVFLSIGYATCHWCHVMERESFEDEAVASAMNETFVAIKVDREERPDIDHIYMEACQIAGGRCGWPLTVMLTPERKPFFVATYIPRETRHGRIGMTDLIPRVAELWQAERRSIEGSAEELTARMRTQSDVAPPSEGIDLSDAVFESLSTRYDPRFGGFGEAPKFPASHNLLFLFEYAWRTEEPRAVEMALSTVDAIRAGGVYDHVGSGIHRYSTDANWRLPHFEKMLYDQALFCMACTDAALFSGNSKYLRIALDTSDYVIRDLSSPEGGFYSAEDADSEGEEGLFYTWTSAELQDALGDSFGSFAARHGIEEIGNFRDEATGEYTGRNVIYTLDTHAESRSDALRILFEKRSHRGRPLKDDKVLTDWNGLMIAALARLGTATDRQSLVESAAAAADWILCQMQRPDGRLLHRYRNGIAGVTGLLDDYANLVWGLLELYQATGSVEWLENAVGLTRTQIDRFGDERDLGFFLSDAASDDLLHRPKEFTDGALPSGNSVTVLNLARLFAVTGDSFYRELGETVVHAASGLAERYPSAFGGLAFSSEVLRGPSTEIVVVGEREDATTGLMLREARRRGSRRTVVLWKSSENAERLVALVPFTEEMVSVAGRATAYVCTSGVCELPVATLEDLALDLASRQ